MQNVKLQKQCNILQKQWDRPTISYNTNNAVQMSSDSVITLHLTIGHTTIIISFNPGTEIVNQLA